MKSEFSETQFAFGVVHEILNRHPNSWSIFFPTQRKENDCGYDVKLNHEVTPVYVQFKVAEYLNRSNARQKDTIGVPYFRFKIWPVSQSPQHNQLVHLAQKGNNVFYIAPKFYTQKDFESYFFNQKLLDYVLFSPCERLREIYGNENHCVIYNEKSTEGIMCSKSKPFHGYSYLQMLKNIDGHQYYRNIDECIMKIITELDLKVDLSDFRKCGCVKSFV